MFFNKKRKLFDLGFTKKQYMKFNLYVVLVCLLFFLLTINFLPDTLTGPTKTGGIQSFSLTYFLFSSAIPIMFCAVGTLYTKEDRMFIPCFFTLSFALEYIYITLINL